ncbi:MAG: hypothetical protein N2651_03685, partial [Fimbriimonadales bacterium]|nr:hypothetical protein [Fimbriimonadales bacterium]
MSSLRWKVKRLLAMSPGEMVARFSRVIQERFAPLPKETPEQTWQRYYPQIMAEAALRSFPERLSLHPEALPEVERARLIHEAD